MNIQQFSDEFDVLLNSYSVLEPFGLLQNMGTIKVDEYEKSVYLTLAQENIFNTLAQRYEFDEEARRRLDTLVVESAIQSSTGQPGTLTPNSVRFPINSDVARIVFERIKIIQASCKEGTELSVLPMRHDEFTKQIGNPFRKPKLSGRYNVAWRIDSGPLLIELVVPNEISSFLYRYRYLKRPRPIVLVDLSAQDLNIRAQQSPQTSEMSEINHEDILKEAVNLCISVIAGRANNQKES